MSERLPHIFVRARAEPVDYTRPTGGSTSKGPRYPSRNPLVHGPALIRDLELARSDIQALTLERQAIGLPHQVGERLEFELSLNPDLKVLELEYPSRGVTLDLVRLPDQPGDPGHAILYVPPGQTQTLVRRLQDYSDPEKISTKTGKHSKEALFNSVSQIRRPGVEDIWGGTDPFPTDNVVLFWEIWIRREVGATRFRQQAQRVHLEVQGGLLTFPEREVVLAKGTPDQIRAAFHLLDAIAELRPPSQLRTIYDMGAVEQAEWASLLAERLEAPDPSAPAVCILDTGLDAGHPLLAAAVDPAVVFSYNSAWGITDHHGHGTRMAGLALYSDRLPEALVSSQRWPLTNWIESGKILPPAGDTDPELWGEITKTLVADAEVKARRPRAFALAVTAAPSPTGEPSSWSAALDQLCSGAEEEDFPRRLMVVSAGNTAWGDATYSYPSVNHVSTVQDPAQSWNAIVVGGYSSRAFPVANYPDWLPVASAGGLSPCSSTGMNWYTSWPNRPDFVLEGGNLLQSPSGDREMPIEFALLSTRRSETARPLFTTMGETSAACALASHALAALLREYPQFWPETVRGLLMHSARWTASMLAEFSDLTPKARMRSRVRCFGMGVASLDRAAYSARHALTLIVQDALLPFDEEGRTNVLHLHRLPWPEEQLLELGALKVQMRVTLSYYIEPNPGARGWAGRYSYPSHGLRFDVRGAGETQDMFLVRINKASRDAGQKAEVPNDSVKWELGPKERARGSLHSDVWEGTAAELADKGFIAVYPVKGWWSERVASRQRDARYSLLVSIETPDTDIDLYTPVEVLAATEIEVEGE